MNQFLPLELCLVERAQRMRCRLGAHHRFELYTDKILVFKWRMVERRAIIHQLHHRPAGIAWPLKKKLHLFIPWEHVYERSHPNSSRRFNITQECTHLFPLDFLSQQLPGIIFQLNIQRMVILWRRKMRSYGCWGDVKMIKVDPC